MNHELSEINYETKTGVCSVCGPVRVKLKGKYGRACWNQVYAGVKRYRARSAAYRAQKKAAKKTEKGREWNKEKHRKLVKMTCERCGFQAKSMAQMDGHHKDGNHFNNEPSNVESLCACCHRLEHLPSHMKITETEPFSAPAGVSVPPEPQKASEGLETVKKGIPEARFEEAKDKVMKEQEVLLWRLRVSEMEDTQKALLEDLGRLSEENESLRQDLEGARSSNVDANGAYWRKMYLDLKSQVARNNDVSQ